MVDQSTQTTGGESQPLRKIVIVGGGTAGWLTAAMLAAQRPPSLYQIQLVESQEVGIIGVGESTIPPFVRLLQKLGISEREFVHRTQGCYKLGIRFEQWQGPRHHYFHPFGTIGRHIDQHDFYQCWLKAQSEGEAPPLMDFSPCAALAKEGGFYPLSPGHKPAGASYALHMDAALAVDFLRDYAQDKGVERQLGTVKGTRRSANGHIECLELANGEMLPGDFFIDCTGFRSLLIGEAAGEDFEDWSDFMPCDRAVAVKTEATQPLVPYTRAIARKAGWSWRIPLRSSSGHGYVYSSRHSSDAEAKSALLRDLDAPRISDPKTIEFKPGKRRHVWKHNCLAVGLSAGFLEPLESTSIHLIARGIEFFLRYFPDRDCDPALAREYNRRISADFEEIRDFILLHYVTSKRRDTAFWRDCAERPMPESLRERLALFKARGLVREGLDPLFRATSWQAVFEGMGIRPRHYHPKLEGLDHKELLHELLKTRRAVQALAKAVPSHEQVLQER